MTDPALADLITVFCQRQLSQTLDKGAEIGLEPVTIASTILQIAAATLAQVAQTETVAILRAYADCIEAGPGDGPLQRDAKAAFMTAAQAFGDAVEAARDFPTPQGRA